MNVVLAAYMLYILDIYICYAYAVHMHKYMYIIAFFIKK